MIKFTEYLTEKKVRHIRISADGKRKIIYTCDGNGEVLKNGRCVHASGAERLTRKKAAKKAAKKRRSKKSQISRKISRAAKRRS